MIDVSIKDDECIAGMLIYIMGRCCSVLISARIGLAQAVEPREVVSAIRDMLSAADLPLGLERERLLEHSLSLQAQLKATQAALSHQRQVRAVYRQFLTISDAL